MVGRTCLAPLVDKLAATQRELGTHIGVAECEDRTFLVDTLGSNELEDAVLILRNSQIGNRTRGRIELGEVTAAGLAMEYRHYLHSRLLGLRDVEVTRA